MSFRKQQVESTLRRIISQVLARELSDPRIVGMVSVTRISLSPDLRDALVFVSVLPEKYEKRTLSGLRHAAGHIQGLVTKAMAMKVIPRLDFRLDESLKKESGVLNAIRKAMERESVENDVNAAAQDSPEADGGAQEGPAGDQGSDASE